MTVFFINLYFFISLSERFRYFFDKKPNYAIIWVNKKGYKKVSELSEALWIYIFL